VEDQPKKSRVKLIAGIIVGGAIASVLGLALAPKKTRKAIKDKAKEVFDKGMEIKDLIEGSGKNDK
jgi:gas vesicle protein